jgi:hypothetical protein
MPSFWKLCEKFFGQAVMDLNLALALSTSSLIYVESPESMSCWSKRAANAVIGGFGSSQGSSTKLSSES